MLLLELTLPTAEENLALDEALVVAAEAGEQPQDVLRLWEPPAPMVVVGRSSQFAKEVNFETCQADGVPVLRRSSGGAAIVAAPGCLMYAVILGYATREHLRMIDRAHDFVLDRIATAISKFAPGITKAGTSDLVVGSQKISGNSMRCCRNHLLYHGTLLYDMDLSLVEKYLRMPPRQPDYRGGRNHGEFVTNLPIERGSLRQSLIEAWQAETHLEAWPGDRTAKLVKEKYSQDAWNRRHN